MKAFLSIVATVMMAAAVPLGAQRSRKQDAGPAPISAIHATGSKRFAEADIVASTGLKKGQEASVADLESAAKELAATGAFKEVTYSYQSGTELRVEFRVADAEEFVPARFDNFAWLPPSQLIEKLHSVVPLFSGELPVRGNLPDQVQQELQSMLSGLAIAGTVRYEREKRGPDDPVTAIDYTVAGVRTEIQKARFPNATAALLPALEEVADPLGGTEYSLARVRNFAEKRLLPVYWSRGYVRASLGAIVPVLGKTSTETTTLDVDIPINEGLQYRLQEVQFSGNAAFPTDRLSTMIRAKKGESLDLRHFNADIQSVGAMYVSRGYVTARVTATPTFNDAVGTVSYAVKVSEGAVYRMGDLDIIQFDQPTSTRLLQEWKLRKDEIFDATYPQRFVQSFIEAGGSPVKIEETLHEQDKTVDVVLRPAE